MGCGASSPTGVYPSASAPPPLSYDAAGGTDEDSASRIRTPRTAEERAAEVRLHKYELGKELGRGSYGTVVEARRKADGLLCALKAISKLKFVGEVEHKLMMDEVAFMGAVKGHPNVVSLFESFENRADFFLILEACTGGELMDVIVSSENFSEATAARYLRDMVLAVQHCHSRCIVHRDLKPENFLLASREPGSGLKLADFGLSTSVKSIEEVLTDPCGTAFYIAPEVFSRAYTASADVWSLGVIMFLLVSGYVPFGSEARTEKEIYDAIVKEPLVFGPVFQGVSPSARELISGMLEKQPTKRYTLEQVLAHPWMASGAAPDVPLSKSAVDALSSFNARNKFKKAAIKLVAATFTAADMADLRAQFLAIDSDGSGFITYAEMAAALAKLGVHDPMAVRDILTAIDANGDGKLSYTEWLHAMTETRILYHQNSVWAAFNAFDLNGDGAVSVDELQQVLKGVSREEAQAYIAEFDTDGDGVIKYDEFLAMMVGKQTTRHKTRIKARSLGL